MHYVAPDFAVQELPFPVRFDQSGPHQFLQVVRNSGFRDREVTEQPLTGTFPFFRDCFEQSHAPRVCKRLSDQLKLAGGQ